MAREHSGPTAAAIAWDNKENIQNVKFDYLFINSYNWRKQDVNTLAYICASCLLRHIKKENKNKTLNPVIQLSRASLLRINDMTSGYTMAFKSKPLTWPASFFIHSAAYKLNHIAINLMIPFNQFQGP